MYFAGIYCRISREEQQKQSEYSNSIQTQIKMAEDFIAEHPDIMETKIYTDEGASGSHFDRTEFRRMLADIEKGVINMVILKDMSRLGREQIDTNYYLGKYFPEKQIRLVSILDAYDSADGAFDELLDIKILLNDMYLRDTSKKIQASIQAKRRRGEYTSKEPPYGYVKNKEFRNRLEADPFAAEVVRRIYGMYISGLGAAAISRILNEDEIAPPARYKKEVLRSGYAWKIGKGLWVPSTVLGILQNPVYTGAVILRKTDKPSYKLQYRKAIPPEARELIPNAHEAIVSKEAFEQAQLLRKKKYVPYFDSNKEPHKYAGILFCGNCNRAMRKRYLSSRKAFDGYVCGFHQMMGRGCCQLNHITFEKLDEMVGFALNQQLKQRKSDLKALELQITKRKPDSEGIIASLEAKSERAMEQRKKTYEQYMDNILSKEEYLEWKRMYERENEQYQKKLQEQRRKEQKQIAYIRDTIRWLENFSEGKLTANQLTREVLAELIDRIYVYPEEKIHIYFRWYC